MERFMYLKMKMKIKINEWMDGWIDRLHLKSIDHSLNH